MNARLMPTATAAAAAAVLLGGCATVATHYQIRAAYEQEARRNAVRGRGPLCAVEGRMMAADDLRFWDMVRAEWPSYLKAVGLDFGTALCAYIIYERSRGHDTSGIQHIYFQTPPGGEAAAAPEAGE